MASARMGPPIVGGSSIEGIESGTVGCLALDGTNTVMLTNFHVLFTDLDPGGAVGRDVGVPEITCCCCCVGGIAGKVIRGVSTNMVDAAIVSINSDRNFQQRIPGIGSAADGGFFDEIRGIAPLKEVEYVDTDGQTKTVMSPVAVGETVRKVGATSGLTAGRVANPAISLPADSFLGLPPLVGQIAVTPLLGRSFINGEKEHFALTGDSGAILVNDNNEVVGLLTRSLDLSGQTADPRIGNGGGATPIHFVLDALGITLPASNEVTTTEPAANLSGHRVFAIERLSPSHAALQQQLLGLQERLSLTSSGSRFARFADAFGREIISLVNENRKVTVAWHRAHGPAFVARASRMPNINDMERSVNGQPIHEALEPVVAALASQGSLQLGDQLSTLWPEIRTALRSSATFDEFVGILAKEVTT